MYRNDDMGNNWQNCSFIEPCVNSSKAINYTRNVVTCVAAIDVRQLLIFFWEKTMLSSKKNWIGVIPKNLDSRVYFTQFDKHYRPFSECMMTLGITLWKGNQEIESFLLYYEWMSRYQDSIHVIHDFTYFPSWML